MAARLDTACALRNVLFCAVDQPTYNDYFHVAVARRGPLSIGISTGGKAPALARRDPLSIGISTGGKAPALAGRLRDELRRLLDDERLDAFVAELEALRAGADPTERARLLRRAALRLRIEGHIQIRDEPEGV